MRIRKSCIVRSTLAFTFYIVLLMLISGHLLAQTSVNSITPSPGSFAPEDGETTTITVEATAETTGMEVRVLMLDHVTLIRSGLALIEDSPGIYTTIWDGKKNTNALVAPGEYGGFCISPPKGIFQKYAHGTIMSSAL